ncbi:MAG: CHASE2 domain-containing protein [Candidatus Omnitrophota bacterium]
MILKPGLKNTFLFLAVLLLALFFLSVSYFRLFERLELIALDLRYNLRRPPAASDDIVLIEIGEDSLSALGRWPFPRDYHASLIDVLKNLGARMVIFDILFSEPTAWDMALEDSADSYGRAYFPFALRLDDTKDPGVPSASGIDAPLLAGIERSAAGTGFINKLVDIDGKVRRVPLFIKYEGKLYPHMSLKAACDDMGIPMTAIDLSRPGYVRIGDRLRIPVDPGGNLLLNFAGKWGKVFEHYSYLDILAAYNDIRKGVKPRLDLEVLKNKVCFVGLTAAGTHELGPTPVEKLYPMMGIHANLFNNIRNNGYLRRLSRLWNLMFLIIISALFLRAILKVRPLSGLFLAAASVLAVFMISVGMFAVAGLWIDVVVPVLALFSIYSGTTLYRYLSEIRHRLQVERELAIAKSIQQSFLPEAPPRTKGLDIAATLITAREVGGDLYDFVEADKKTGVMVGDVSGKGVPAALFMARTMTLFKIFSKEGRSPAMVLKKINDELTGDYRSGLFVTLLYGLFDSAKKNFIFSNAGHLPAIIVRAKGSGMEVIEHREGMAAGIMEEANFSDKTIELSRGDMVVLYTDGVTEAMDAKRREFGMDALKEALRSSGDGTSQDTLDRLLRAIRSFQGRADQHDDITAVVIRVE